MLCDQEKKSVTEQDEERKRKTDNHQLTDSSTDQRGNNTRLSQAGHVVTKQKRIKIFTINSKRYTSHINHVSVSCDT